MKYPAKNPAKFLKPEPEPDIEAGYPAGSGFSRISGRFLDGGMSELTVRVDGNRGTSEDVESGRGESELTVRVDGGMSE